MADSPVAAVPKFRFSVFEADAATGELRKHGIRLRLADQPFNVLIALLERPGELVTREELVKRLWPDGTFVDYDHSLNTAINKLREVLGDSAATPKFIETLPKRGYRFVGSAERIGEPEQQHIPETQASFTRPSESGSELPKASRGLVRTLFILAQIMYLGFYIAALVNWGEIHWLVGTVFGEASSRIITTVVLVTAMAGIPLRLFLLTAVSWDYAKFRQKYDRMFLAIAVLDLLWGVSPLLTAHHIGIGITLAVSAMLLYLTFGQRTLVHMAYH
jgi:DNA-binding winged helix-turn-helix (wHTH) protein